MKGECGMSSDELLKNLKEELMGMSIENDLQVVAIARILEFYDFKRAKDAIERFKKAVYEAFENGSIDLNDIEKNTFNIDYFNDELKEILRNVDNWNFEWEFKHILTGDGLMWHAYQRCFDDGKFDALKRVFRIPPEFNELVVGVFDEEVEMMGIVGFDNLVKYFREMLANCKKLYESKYYYNMFALVFTFIYNLEKGGEDDD